MPTLPLTTGQTGLAGGDLPVTGSPDIETLLASFLKATDAAPVRAALVAAVSQMCITYQLRSERAAALSSVTRSIGSPLKGLARDYGVLFDPSDNDETLRGKILVAATTVTPAAIMAAVTSIVSRYSLITPRYWESVADRWFVGTGARPWHSFVWTSTSNRTPQYSTRLYSDDAAANAGVSIAARGPGGAMVFSDTSGRLFGIRIPDLSSANVAGSYTYVRAGVAPVAGGGGFFIGTGSSALNAGFVRSNGASSFDIYASIIAVVTRLKGQGVRWTLIVDPKLK